MPDFGNVFTGEENKPKKEPGPQIEILKKPRKPKEPQYCCICEQSRPPEQSSYILTVGENELGYVCDTCSLKSDKEILDAFAKRAKMLKTMAADFMNRSSDLYKDSVAFSKLSSGTIVRKKTAGKKRGKQLAEIACLDDKKSDIEFSGSTYKQAPNIVSYWLEKVTDDDIDYWLNPRSLLAAIIKAKKHGDDLKEREEIGKGIIYLIKSQIKDGTPDVSLQNLSRETIKRYEKGQESINALKTFLKAASIVAVYTFEDDRKIIFSPNSDSLLYIDFPEQNKKLEELFRAAKKTADPTDVSKEVFDIIRHRVEIGEMAVSMEYLHYDKIVKFDAGEESLKYLDKFIKYGTDITITALSPDKYILSSSDTDTVLYIE